MIKYKYRSIETGDERWTEWLDLGVGDLDYDSNLEERIESLSTLDPKNGPFIRGINTGGKWLYHTESRSEPVNASMEVKESRRKGVDPSKKNIPPTFTTSSSVVFSAFDTFHYKYGAKKDSFDTSVELAKPTGWINDNLCENEEVYDQEIEKAEFEEEIIRLKNKA